MRGISEDHHAKAGGKNWRARVRVEGKEQTLGRWHTAEEAESFLTQYWAKVVPDSVPWLFADYLDRVPWYTEEIALQLRAQYPQAELPLPSEIVAKRQAEEAAAAAKAQKIAAKAQKAAAKPASDQVLIPTQAQPVDDRVSTPTPLDVMRRKALTAA